MNKNNYCVNKHIILFKTISFGTVQSSSFSNFFHKIFNETFWWEESKVASSARWKWIYESFFFRFFCFKKVKLTLTTLRFHWKWRKSWRAVEIRFLTSPASKFLHNHKIVAGVSAEKKCRNWHTCCMSTFTHKKRRKQKILFLQLPFRAFIFLTYYSDRSESCDSATSEIKIIAYEVIYWDNFESRTIICSVAV